jgi:ATP-binding cassette, subfamily F, member 3
MLQLNDITKSFIHKTVLDNVQLFIGRQSRIGLIGRNGCGKSTLLRIIMGEMEIDDGSIYRAPGIKINCLTQEPRITAGNTLEQELKSVFSQENELALEEAILLANLESLTDPEQQTKTLNRLTRVHQDMERLDTATIDSKICRMAQGLGFSLSELQSPVELFSGGWQMRINLAKVLLEGADILLLDEPTNHLDLETCNWLETFLAQYPGGLLVVSHDRHFLDALVTEVAEIELGRLTLWPGNYSQYLTQKSESMERLMSEAARQEKELGKQMAFVERFRASATKSTQAKSREKQLSKIERIEVPQTDTKKMSVRFPPPQLSGKQVLVLSKLRKAFGEKLLFESVEAELKRGQRVFLLGANGCGKSTLLRLILGLETPDTGEIRLGHNTQIGYFSQNQLEMLDVKLSAFDTLHNARPDMTQTEIRSLLGRFLFTGEQVFKPVSVLSGGEKSKLALAKLMLSGPNTLLLDEPTNHMDIPAKEVLEEAFREFQGTFLCISHDRFFIQQLATEIWEIVDGRLLQYPGDYDYYLSQRETMREAYRTRAASKSIPKLSPVESPSAEPRQSIQDNTRSRKELEKQIKLLEKTIMSLETELASLHERLSDPEIQQDYLAVQALGKQVEAKELALTQSNQEWESLIESLNL